MNLILLLILLGVGIYIYKKDSTDWVEIYQADESSLNEVQLRIKYLKDRGLKPRLKASGFKGMLSQPTREEVSKVKIIVRKKHEKEARDYLEEYSLEEY